MYAGILKCHNPSSALMNLYNGADKNNTDRKSKAKAAMPIAGILVASTLKTGLLFVIGSDIAIAQQQNMTGTNATSMNATSMNATGTNATSMNATGTNATDAIGTLGG